jgi:uncharacterized protein
MKASHPEPGLEQIQESECLQLLEAESIGRIAMVAEGQPEIFPITYSLRAGVVVFRTASGTKLSYAPASRVAFEIDGFDSSTGVGWSVVVKGVAHDVTDAADDFSWAARGATVYPLAPGEKAHRIAIEPSQITGRRFRRDPGASH